MRYKIILPAMLLTGVLAFGTLGVTLARAQNSANYPPIIQKLAERFDLDEAEVFDVFQQAHDEHHAEMEAQLLQRLEDAVVDGTLTEEKRDQLIDKHEEMEATLSDLRYLDPEERRARAQDLHEEFRQWLIASGIDTNLFPAETFTRKNHRMVHSFTAVSP